ncbi:hypothetical protein EKE94_07960 [Mesobaculum littorinae]|uniref:Secreted protein n=1 Tax=Mesobaculum littorinae TaxID=2486419 RepID=A0A438AJ77_9RHOB|nr:hypothetical protein [Mesobaculum littorinae]RVV98823.1 hypothetical protein EKE94_07960 [Mesobaculum littorinae]
MRRVILTLSLLFPLAMLTACQTGEDAGPEAALPPVGESYVAVQKAQCQADGGRWGRGGKAGHVCYRTPQDANASCSSADDCSSHCLARSRTCAPVTPLFGCNEVLTSGGYPATICLD